MGLLMISGPVRQTMGRDADALNAGTGLPAEAQCWACGDTINMFAAKPGEVSLSCVVAVPGVNITTFGHADHAPSRVFNDREFDEAVKAAGTHPEQMRSPIAPSPLDQSVIVKGKRIL